MRELVLEITKKCQNLCVFCSSDADLAGLHLPTAKLLALICEAKTLGIKDVALSGGEPFLHPDINDLISAIIEQKFERFAIYTSGNVGRSELSNFVLDRLREAGVTLIFNVQSILRDVHEALTAAPESYDAMMESLDRALEFGVHVECHIVPNKMNMDSLFDTGHALLNRGVDRVSFLRFVPQGRASNSGLAIENTEELRRVLAGLYKAAPDKYRFGIPFSEVIGETRACVAGADKIVLRHDGYFVPCEALKGTDKFILGRFGEVSLATVISQALESEKLTEFRCNRRGCVCPADEFWRGCG